MIKVIAAELPRPALCVVGEPTMMQVVHAHKGVEAWRVTVNGHEAHSAQTHLGVSAIMQAAPLIAHLAALAQRLELGADPASPFLPKHSTLTIGRLNGGTAANILARECWFVFDLRSPPGVDNRAILAGFLALCAQTDAAIKAAWPDGGVKVEQLSDVPAFAPETDGAAEAFVRRLTGDNGPASVASFASEAGQFQQGGFSTILCGPGSIDQAHQPDEYVDIAQLERGADFMARLVAELAQAG